MGWSFIPEITAPRETTPFMKKMNWLAIAGVVVAATFTIRWHRELESASAARQTAHGDLFVWQVKLSETEEKRIKTERFAAEAEQDRLALMKALESMRPPK